MRTVIFLVGLLVAEAIMGIAQAQGFAPDEHPTKVYTVLALVLIGAMTLDVLEVIAMFK